MQNIVRVLFPMPSCAALLIVSNLLLLAGCDSQPASAATAAHPEPSPKGLVGDAAATSTAPHQIVPLSKHADYLANIVAEAEESSRTAQSRQKVSVTETVQPSILVIPQASTPIPNQSDLSRQVQVVVDHVINALFEMDYRTWFGLAIVVAMMCAYSLENRSPFFVLAFGTCCWIGSAFGYLRGSWQLATAGAIWGFLALWKYWRVMKSTNDGMRKPEHLLAVWHIRFIGVLAVISGIVLLVVDSPLAVHLPIRISRPVAEAIPLLLVGVGYLAWLAVDRPSAIDLVKQALIAVAFILWGITLLMPAGPSSTFAGAVVIAIYVFDLAWLMEGNLRKALLTSKEASGCTSADCMSAGVCRCEEVRVSHATAKRRVQKFSKAGE